MGIDEIIEGQHWRLINVVNRPDVIIHRVNKYSDIVFWRYENENRISENEFAYFIKNFKLVQ